MNLLNQNLEAAALKARVFAHRDDHREAARLRRLTRNAIKRSEIKATLIYRVYGFIAVVLITIILFLAKNQ